ncbi:hypothetical protein DICPUDRAFT_78377 [Dictyostelium purpureum]|uniref:Uncharacterized protein n=1 Tax=Dictyostelium purpureum TaxID=5786 RepID=F0ZJD2_DICPU|nr:uncharacterized protein DICPUDRAFT_78377 [Dictyostelium purpureum]EGC35959.1 hypothetical protein DICPUDRAFT_78377 [Dictyostelium purpureum]|eukprot:XP_003287532.1 hypothetical protein DICPUDRAFT_78377 [Dictyostelium purpureum]
MSNENSIKKPHEWVHDYPFDTLDIFYMNQYSENCNEACIQEYKTYMDEIIKKLQIISLINQSVKVKEDGTIPEFSICRVFAYYAGDEDAEDIQDLFNINILDLDIPWVKKRTDIPKNIEN